MTSYHGGAGVKIFALDPAHIRLQFEPQNGAIMSADLTVDEAKWIAHQLLALIVTALPEDGELCETCGGTGYVACWSPGGPCPAPPPCVACGPCVSCAGGRRHPMSTDSWEERR